MYHKALKNEVLQAYVMRSFTFFEILQFHDYHYFCEFRKIL